MKKITLFFLVAALLSINAIAQTGNLGLSFDGIDDRVTIPNNTAYNVGTGNFTIEAWVKLNTIQNVTFPSIISKRDAGNVNSGFLLMIYQGRVMMQIAGINLGQGTTNIQDNICHHVAVTRTGTVVNYYIDGNLDLTVNNSGSINTIHALWIGRDDPSPSNTQFKGLIHELRYWNIARTQSQIQAAKNGFLVGNESGLKGYWRMNDGTGQTVNDLTSLNNDGFLGTVNTTDSADPVYQSNCLCPSTITAGGAVTFCTGGSVVLTATAGAGLTYQWKLNGNNISGATSQSYTASAGGNYTCVVTGSCGSNTSNTITVTVYTTVPAANITAGGPTTFCSNSNVLLSSTNTGTGITYQWQKNSVNISGAVSANYSANQTGSYRCIVTNPCGSSTSNAISVTVNTAPAAVITPGGTVNICSGQTIQLNASSGTGYVYQWKKNAVDISGATSQTYTASQAGSYTVRVTLGSCTATSSATTVTVNQALTPTITNSGFGGFCGSTAINLQTNFGTGYLYTWFEDAHPIPNSNNNALDVGHNGNYSVKINNGCGTHSSSPYTVTDFNNPWFQPYITITNTGSLNLCGGGSVNLSINSSTFYNSPSFQWYKNGVPISGANGTSYNAVTGGNYVCSVTDFLWCGFQGPLVFSNWLVATSAPSATITPPGAASFCSGGSIVLSANTGGGFTYQWKNNGSNIAGATLQNYSATTAGSYTIVVTNTCGTATSAAVNVTVNPLPSAAITPSGSVTMCANQNVVLNAPVAANRSYQWKKTGNNIAGATSSSYTATTGGSYKVTVTNTITGCSKTSATATIVTVNAQPNATITPQGPTTFCAGGSVVLKANSGTGLTYKWKKNGTVISGATSINYTATTAGTYKVQVTNSNGCTRISAGVDVTVPCREGENLSDLFDVKVRPNPSSGDFIFDIENANTEKIVINIFDVVGKIVFKTETFSSECIIGNLQLSPGIYSAVISNGTKEKVVKLVKTE